MAKDVSAESIKLHYELKGKIEVASRAKVDSSEALSLAYTPGVAAVCKEIEKDPENPEVVLTVRGVGYKAGAVS